LPGSRDSPAGLAGKASALEFKHLYRTGPSREFVEARRHPRYKFEAEIRVYARNAAVVRGHTVDISESGISAMLRVEVPIGEVVRLALMLPLGEVEIHALVRQRSAFRYGFQFVETSSAQDLIGRTCRQLAVAEVAPGESASAD
jgi:PilZ domain-containing protein